MSIDFTKLQAATRAAAETAFTHVRTEHPDEHFYAFALYTDDGVMTIMPAANTEEGFLRKAGPDSEEAGYYRWATGEWMYEAVGQEAFSEVYDELNDPDRDESEEEEQFTAFKNQVVETMVSALADLDAQGFFGIGPERESVTLFVSISDSDESEEIENASAQRLNSASVYERFARRYQN